MYSCCPQQQPSTAVMSRIKEKPTPMAARQNTRLGRPSVQLQFDGLQCIAPARQPRVREGRGSGAGVRADPDAKRSSSDEHDREALAAYALSHQYPQTAPRPA